MTQLTAESFKLSLEHLGCDATKLLKQIQALISYWTAIWSVATVSEYNVPHSSWDCSSLVYSE